MTNALIICHGFLGDHLFASSIARKLKEEGQFDEVDYVVGFPQIIPFFELNPYIDKVIFSGEITPSPTIDSQISATYHRVVQLSALSFIVPPCVEMQTLAGVQHPSPDFVVYTDSAIDLEVKKQLSIVNPNNSPVVAIMDNWQPKAFGFTKEEYYAGINVPYLGYGGRLRNIPHIIDIIQKNVGVIFVGTPPGFTQFDVASRQHLPTRTLLEEASILKHCTAFVGQEGGLYNIAVGVGCKTIIGAEFLAQLYGPNGCIKRIDRPQLGGDVYFPERNHCILSPFLTDDELANQTIDIINNNSVHTFDWSELIPSQQ